MGAVTIFLLFGGIVLNLFAMRSIITKAGYSPNWILVPVMPVVLFFTTMIVEFIDLRTIIDGSSFFSFRSNFEILGILSGLTILSIFVSWVFFIVFAFSDWPVGPGQRQPASRAAAPRPPVIPVSAGLPIRMTPVSGATLPSGQAPSAGGLHFPTPPPPETIYCPWCAKPRAVNAHAIHHCGPLDRPAVYCTHCGEALTESTGRCSSCDAPATKVKHQQMPQAPPPP